MGLSPSQGHNNLRLYHTTPYYHSHRLDDTKHNLHFLHNLQNNSNSKCSQTNNRQSKRQRSPKSFRFSAERPRYLFENGLHKSQPSFRSYHSDSNLIRSNERYLRKSFPLLSNLPFINRDASIVLINHSPFGLKDPRFGIFHHCSQSVSYFWLALVDWTLLVHHCWLSLRIIGRRNPNFFLESLFL